MPSLLVEARGLGHTYRQSGPPALALAQASFRILKGDRIAFTGPSGSGKSTLMHLIAGLETPTEGMLSWPGLGPRERLLPFRIGLAFQAPSLLPPLTVRENVALPLLMGGADAGIETAVEAALEIFRIRDLADKLPDELSGGQAQRAALARAIAPGPGLLLADEPTSQLDQRTAQEVLDALLGHLDGTETALVIATHDLAVARRMRTQWVFHKDSHTMSEPPGGLP